MASIERAKGKAGLSFRARRPWTRQRKAYRDGRATEGFTVFLISPSVRSWCEAPVRTRARVVQESRCLRVACGCGAAAAATTSPRREDEGQRGEELDASTSYACEHTVPQRQTDRQCTSSLDLRQCCEIKLAQWRPPPTRLFDLCAQTRGLGCGNPSPPPPPP